MTTEFKRQRVTFHSYKQLATACILSAALAVQLLAGTAIAQPSHEPKLAPVLNEKLPNRIPNQYIVVFKPGTKSDVVLAAQRTVKKLDGTVEHTYSSALIGFSAKLPASALKAMRAAPGVAYIEVDQVGDLNTIQPPNPPLNPPTGLDRTSERFLPLDIRYTYSETGTGVHVYVIDTGIRATHTEFGGRVSGGVNTMAAASGTDDCHGHGTHVAGTIGGLNYGIAKGVFLHPVRAGDCNNTYLAPVIAAVDWVTANRTLPAVVNLSSGFGNSPALNTAVTNSIASLVTYVVAAGNSSADACNTSPALVPAAITVGAIDPANDTRAGFSNVGTCLDLFAPGVNILSTGNANDTATATMSGTSMASPHVAGVAARYLQTHPLATPAAVWTAIHNADNIVPTTMGWAGIINPGAGSPNELLHYGSLNDGVNDGDPHIITVNGIHYDFQNAGEFVSLRDANSMEIQTRQTPVATAPWVSVNTAIAARVGTHRVTWQPNISGVPDPSGLQLRVDGVLTTIGANGLDLGSGGRVMNSVGDGIEINFPDGTALFATPNWWASQSQWYINVRVFHTPATEGIMGVVEPNSWLLKEFADTWRVTDKTSLFDYASNTSTKTFTLPGFPQEKIPPMKPENLALAQRLCGAFPDKNMHADCVFDVAVTGDPIFAKSSLISQRIQRGATITTVNDDRDPTQVGETVTFTATVAQHAPGRAIPAGMVQFTLDGKEAGRGVRLDSNGQARWKTLRITAGNHRVAAQYVPGKDSVFLPSSSLDENHTVGKRQ